MWVPPMCSTVPAPAFSVSCDRHKRTATSGVVPRADRFLGDTILSGVGGRFRVQTRRMNHCGLWRMFHAKQDPPQD